MGVFTKIGRHQLTKATQRLGEFTPQNPITLELGVICKDDVI